jgi:hypothetical protein
MEDYSHLDKKAQRRVKRGLPPYSKNELKRQKNAEKALIASVDKHIRF